MLNNNQQPPPPPLPPQQTPEEQQLQKLAATGPLNLLLVQQALNPTGGGASPGPGSASPADALDPQQLMMHQMNAWLQGVQAALSIMPVLMRKTPAVMVPSPPAHLTSGPLIAIPVKAPVPAASVAPVVPTTTTTTTTCTMQQQAAISLVMPAAADLSMLTTTTGSVSSSDDSMLEKSSQDNKKSATGEPVVIVHTARRIKANARERSRVHTISAAFENLRTLVPNSHTKMSKLAILRIAAAYIETLAALLNEDDEEEQEQEQLTSGNILNHRIIMDFDESKSDAMDEEGPEDLSMKSMSSKLGMAGKKCARGLATHHDSANAMVKLPRLMPNLSLDQCRNRLMTTINSEIKSIRRTGYMICDANNASSS